MSAGIDEGAQAEPSRLSRFALQALSAFGRNAGANAAACLVLALAAPAAFASTTCNRDLTKDPLVIQAIEQGRIDVARVDFGQDPNTAGIAMAAFETDGFFIVQIDERLVGANADAAFQTALCRIRSLLAGNP